MIRWTNPEAHFANAYVGDCKVAAVRTERDRAVAVFYVGQIGSAAWRTPAEARSHVERFVASWILAAGLTRIEQRAAS